MELPEWMIHQSFRYCLGRCSYAVGQFCDWAVENWDNIPDMDRQLIIQELEDAFELDEETPHSLLGMNCDKQEWSRIRALYRKI